MMLAAISRALLSLISGELEDFDVLVVLDNDVPPLPLVAVLLGLVAPGIEEAAVPNPGTGGSPAGVPNPIASESMAGIVA